MALRNELVHVKYPQLDENLVRQCATAICWKFGNGADFLLHDNGCVDFTVPLASERRVSADQPELPPAYHITAQAARAFSRFNETATNFYAGDDLFRSEELQIKNLPVSAPKSDRIPNLIFQLDSARMLEKGNQLMVLIERCEFQHNAQTQTAARFN